ncbi:MAG: septum formation family protein [Mycobacteriales bacterium]
MAEDDDPFEGLVLDEDFVRGAASYEPPARTRAAISRHRPEPPRSWSPEPRVRRARRRVIAVVIGVLALVGVAAFVVPGGPGRPSQVRARPAPSPTEGTLSEQLYLRGHCYTWDQSTEHTTARDVGCGAPHLFEVVSHATVHGYPAAAPYPTRAQWVVVTHKVCDPPVTRYLQHALDPFGRYGSGDIRPAREGWALGERDLWCGVIFSGQAAFGAPPQDDLLTAFRGRADASHQELLYPTGTCLRFTATDSGSVPCSAPHSAEVAGAVTVVAPATPPSSAAFRRLAEGPCRAQVSGYVGHRFVESSTQYVGWEQPRAASWRAGTRTFSCYLSFSRAGRSADVIGSHGGPALAV